MSLKKNIHSLFVILLLIGGLFPLFSVLGNNQGPKLSFRIINEQTVENQRELNSYNLSLLYKDKYHNLSEVYNELQYFNETVPEIVDYSFIGLSYYGNGIPLVTLTNENIPEESKSKTYIVAHHHAREMCTIEETLRLIRDLVNEYGYDDNTTSLLNRIIIYIIVTLNPDSLDYTLYENEHFRKSMKPYDDDGDGLFDEDGPEDINNDGKISEYAIYNATNFDIISRWIEGIDRDNDGKIAEDPPGGVDLNRNYPFHWNDSRSSSGSTSDKTSFSYPGPAPLSENETRVLDAFVKKNKFTHALSLHSGVATLLYGWSWNRKIPQAEDSIYSAFVSDISNKRLLPPNFYPFNSLMYTCAGEWGDYMYSEYKIIPMTLEIYGKNINSFLTLIDENDTHKTYERKFYDFKSFNPPKEELESLHSALYNFNKFWLSLTPRITLSSISTKKIQDNENEITLKLRSGSQYWNTTDKPKLKIIASEQGIIGNYSQEIPTLFPIDQDVRILLYEITDNFSLKINISSEWASDLSVTLIFSPEDFKPNQRQTNGFILITSLILMTLFVRKRKITI